MTVTIELTPEETERLQAAAQSRGVDIATVLHKCVSYVPAPTNSPLSDAEFEALLDEIGEGGDDLPLLPGETYNRETIYFDHD